MDAGALFRAHAEAVRAKLRSLCGDGPEVDDLLQNVFVIAHRKYAKAPKTPELARAWLLETARKQAANWHRLFRHTYEVLDVDAVLVATAEPEDSEAHAALCDLVRRALCDLEEDECELLVRHHVLGETCAELAVWLGLSRAGAGARLQAAEECMRGIVRRYGENGEARG
jgi:RNA polymerase sigma-70 factor (ECF subfamily)